LEYLAASRPAKPFVARRIIHEFHLREGRFLKRTKNSGENGKWNFIELTEARSYEKVRDYSNKMQ
jgi:hypothetical protein